MKLIIDVDEKLVCEGFERTFTEEERDILIRAIGNGVEYVEPKKGKWVAKEDMDYLDQNNVYHNHFMCDKCGFIHDFLDGHTSQYQYCPECGAKLEFVWL